MLHSDSKFVIDLKFVKRFTSVLLFFGFVFLILSFYSIESQGLYGFWMCLLIAILFNLFSIWFYAQTVGFLFFKKKNVYDKNSAIMLSLDALDGLPMYISLQKPDHSVLYGNKLFNEIFENANHYCYQKMKNKKLPCSKCTLYNDLKINGTQSWEWQSKEGRWFYVSDRLYIDSMGEEFILEAGVEISNLKKIEEQLRYAKEVAESANRAKSYFLTNMSHEIRTPMNSILGFADILALSDVSDEVSDQIKVILNSAEHLLQIIDDMLDLSLIEAGTIRLKESVFDLKKLIEEVTQIIEPMIKDGVCFSFNSEKIESNLFYGDSFRIRQILLNLLSNSSKFTDSGKVVFVVEESHLDEKNSLITFQVIDTGVGISSEYLEKIFSPFVQENNSLTRKVHGVGLGLTISNRLANLLGGTISVESELGKGSEFKFLVPLMRSSDSQSISHSNFDVKKINDNNNDLIQELFILVVEDDLSNQKLIERFLKNFGCSCMIVDNGKEAFEAVKKNQFKVVLMDIQMPIMDGLEATRLINEYDPSIYIIGLSAHALEEQKQFALLAGMNDYLVKPIRPAYLKSALDKASHFVFQNSDN